MTLLGKWDYFRIIVTCLSTKEDRFWCLIMPSVYCATCHCFQMKLNFTVSVLRMLSISVPRIAVFDGSFSECVVHMLGNFDAFHLLVITGVTFVWVFNMRTFCVSYILRGHRISTWFFYHVCEQALLLSASQCVIQNVCSFRLITVACGKRSMI